MMAASNASIFQGRIRFKFRYPNTHARYSNHKNWATKTITLNFSNSFSSDFGEYSFVNPYNISPNTSVLNGLMISGGDWYGSSGKVNTIFGAVASVVEAGEGSLRLRTTTQGFSPKYYGNAWNGNQYAKTFNISKLGNVLGKISFGLGVAMDIRGMMIYKKTPNSPNAVHPAKFGLNTGMGAYGLWVNPVGAMLYFGVDAFYPGGWSGALQHNASLIQQNQAILGSDWNLYKDY